MTLFNHYHTETLFILKRLENRHKLRLLDKLGSILRDLDKLEGIQRRDLRMRRLPNIDYDKFLKKEVFSL